MFVLTDGEGLPNLLEFALRSATAGAGSEGDMITVIAAAGLQGCHIPRSGSSAFVRSAVPLSEAPRQFFRIFITQP